MKFDDAIDLSLFIGSLAAMAWGLSCELSPAWAAVIVGGIVMLSVLLARFVAGFTVRRKQPEGAANESA